MSSAVFRYPRQGLRHLGRGVQAVMAAAGLGGRGFSIRTKIFFGCLSLTFVTMIVGVLSQETQSELSRTALGIYDNAFVSMSYLRSAQSTILSISDGLAVGDSGDEIVVDQLQSALDALDVARERAMSPRAEFYAKQLQIAVAELQAGFKGTRGFPGRQAFRAVEQTFDLAVEVSAADGFRLRRSVEALVWRTQLQTYGALVASIVAAVVITIMLSRAIVPSIRHAVQIATAIAAGRLDNRIDPRGDSETGLLLKALAAMQASIAEQIAFIETLMARQASSHAAEIAAQHARFKAALNHLTLGLCMFDAADTLLVHNRRFVEMFASEGETDVAAILPRLGLDGPPRTGSPAGESRSFDCLLPDGRVIGVCEEAMEGGGRVVTYEDVTERQRAEARLSHMARHDALTGLPNRILFRERLELGIAGLGAGGLLSLLCLDLDRFKAVNDTLGHPVGDRLLCEVATRLLQTSGDADMVVRLGGDEFAIIQRSLQGSATAAILAQRIIVALASPFVIDGHHISVGASLGIVEATDPGDTPDTLLKHADLALYLAKAEGRGTYRFFERSLDAHVQSKRQLELDLRRAIAEGQFELYYQPILNTYTGAVVAFEALLRWHHPERGFVLPGDFIPLAEETGLIVDIGTWVLGQACRDASDWPNDVKVAINLSALQVQSPTLMVDVAAALAGAALAASRVELEITETLMLRDTDATLASLHELRQLGISISMDDFGTGYASLSSLRRFPFDKIKIDRSFISNVDQGSDGLAVVEAVIALARAMRMRIVAEGVETGEQMDLLCASGCEEVQGYLFSRPQPADVTLHLAQRFAASDEVFWRRAG